MTGLIPSVEIFAPVRDEEEFVSFFYEFYSSRLSRVAFTFFDKGSSDNTVEMSLNLGIRVVVDPEEYFNDSVQIKLKNSCWKNSTADFVIIQDLDELLDVDDAFLCAHEFDAIQAEAWDMVGEGQDLKDIKRGVRLPKYDKFMMFKPSKFSEINYTPGAHTCDPKFKDNSRYPVILQRPMYHYNFRSLDYVLKKYNSRKSRLSEENIVKKHGVQYLQPAETTEGEYKSKLSSSLHILPVNQRINPDVDPLESIILFYRRHFGSVARYILDLGSRDGDDADYLRQKLSGQRILCVEADPDSAKQIKQRYPDFNVVNTAIGIDSKNGSTEFYRVLSEDKEYRGSSSLDRSRVEIFPKYEEISVPIATVKSILTQENLNDTILDIVKIDCEGYSAEVLMEFGDQINNVKLFHIETETFQKRLSGKDSSWIEKFMSERGFILVDKSYEWSVFIEDQVWVNPQYVLYQKDCLLSPMGRVSNNLFRFFSRISEVRREEGITGILRKTAKKLHLPGAKFY